MFFQAVHSISRESGFIGLFAEAVVGSLWFTKGEVNFKNRRDVLRVEDPTFKTWLRNSGSRFNAKPYT